MASNEEIEMQPRLSVQNKPADDRCPSHIERNASSAGNRSPTTHQQELEIKKIWKLLT
jgi:hypothetical protein